MVAEADDREITDKDQLYWRREIERADKYFQKFWAQAEKLEKLYSRQKDEQSSGKRQYAMLWANTEVLKPAVYARPPVPQVSRRYKDKDPVGRLAAEILERSSSYEFERMNIDRILRTVRDDNLLPGRGVAWVRYEADIEAGADGTEQVGQQRVMVDHINVKQFRHNPARTWAEVTWVSKETYLTDAQGKKRFGEKWKDVLLDHKSEKSTLDDDSLTKTQEARATVYEIWDKTSKQVIFLAKGGTEPLEKSPPLLKFDGFFPCPPPVYSTLTNESLIPTPDYKYYQDQAEEIDLLTARIHSLTDSLKLVGFYPLGAEGDVPASIERALKPGVENTIIGVKSWAAFSERGGTQQIAWLPIRDVVEVIKACVELRNQLIQDVYQISGISDIQRGASDPNETLGAQQIKAQWGSIRIRDRQGEMARFARDLTRMTCEVMAENFEPEYLLQMSNMQMPEPPPPPPLAQMTGDPQANQQAQQALQQHQQAMQAYQAEMEKYNSAFALLRDEKLRGFRIDIETDSTIQPDEDAEKQRRTEFVTAIGSILQQAAPLIMQAPELMPMVQESLLFTARGFRAGRTLEDSIEQSLTALKQRVTQMVQQQPTDPNAGAAEAKAKQAEQDIAHKTRLNDEDFMHKQRMNQLEYDNRMQTAQADRDIMQINAETGLQSTKKKLREQIIAEEQEAFMGEPGEQTNALAQVLGEAFSNIAAVLAESNQAVVNSNAQVLQALQAPKVITAPDGRTYTAQTQILN